MPPRRSRQAPLPTPTASNKSESIASTPGTDSSTGAKLKGRRVASKTGLVTPVSLADANEIKVEVEEMEVDISPTQASSQSSLETSPTPSSRSRRSRMVIDSVQIPQNKRSRLGVEKTGSADNLTLTSSRTSRSKNTMIHSDPLDSLSSRDIKPSLSQPDIFQIKDEVASSPSTKRSKTSGSRPDYQPFNVGKFSAVKKESAAALSLDSPASFRSSRGKGKAKAVAKKEFKRDPDSETEEEAEDDFAMDSEEEAEQLRNAIKASKSETRAGSSSKPVTKGRAGRAALNGKALSRAVAKAAESRVKAELADGSFEPSTVEATPDHSIDTESEFKLSTAEESALSSAPEESDDSASDFSDGDLSDAPKKKSPPGKGKAKAKPKGGRKWGPGTRLGNGELVDDTPSTPMSLATEDSETLAKTAEQILAAAQKRREERIKHEELMAPIRKAETQLKQKLGRKLTNGEKNFIRLAHHHDELRDVWGDLKERIKPIKPVTMEAHPSLKLTLLPFQKESLYWMKEQEKGQWAGGMLADEMGMGKTIQTIALLLSEPRQKPSLVVAPVVALMQWKHEIEENTDNFTVCVWHGQGRMKAAELKKYDVVLSSYGTLEASFRRQQRGFKRGDFMIKEKSPLHTFQWHRVILDEAHNIKERSTNAAKAAFALDSKYRWCLSGTPLQNRVGELYSLVRFLGADPFSHYFCKKCDCKSLHWQFKDKRHCDQCGHKPMDHVCFWNTEILTPIAKYGIEPGNPGHEAFKKLKILLDRMMLRRTKLERADDLGLPPRTIVVRRDYFSPEEKELYMSLFSGAKRQFATYVGQGTVLNNYSNIFSLITRMRQMACHPDLVLRSKTSKLAQEVNEGVVCRLCNDQAEDAIASACKHVFDRECIRQYLEVQQLRGHRPECPVCHIEISIDLEAEPIDLTEGQGTKARQGILSRLNLDKWRSSTKLEALVEELHKLREQDSTIKSLVFSQFVSFLDLCAFRLQRAGFTICRLEGGMTPQQRDATIQHFMKNTNVSVFLISLKAGGVALNLTEASMVFMMDSWWNPSVEYQAMDRIHRLGQHRPVKVVKLVVEDSIEDQIVQLQSKKLAMTEAALSRDPDAALGKLTVEDLGFLFKM